VSHLSDCVTLLNLVPSDPDDFIFPRIATRVGPKYQANVPPAVDPTPLPGVFELSFSLIMLISHRCRRTWRGFDSGSS
jgi:hypothetical protein